MLSTSETRAIIDDIESRGWYAMATQWFTGPKTCGIALIATMPDDEDGPVYECKKTDADEALKAAYAAAIAGET